MGNDWAWPCSERDHRNYKHDIRKPTSKFQAAQPGNLSFGNIQQIKYTQENASQVFMIIAWRTDLISQFMNGQLQDDYASQRIMKNSLVPISIVDHPSESESAVIIYRSSTTAQGMSEYRSYSFNLQHASLEQIRIQLENSINRLQNEKAMTFIGATGGSTNGTHLIMEVENIYLMEQSFFYVHPMYSLLTQSVLEKLLNQQAVAHGATLKGIVAMNSDVFFLIFKTSDVRKKYSVKEFPQKYCNNDPDFADELASAIENWQQFGYSFIGLVSCPVSK